ncbi:hypothetical protein CC2G_003164 [Coprinopsis cinerea AmutBmut pab1-1]|nr:hypothetical protein CC2G_003164 [Coprinopsis cinerea AmutBmut pab1-1]
MSFITLIVTLSIFWLALHALFAYFRHSSSGNSSSQLPFRRFDSPTTNSRQGLARFLRFLGINLNLDSGNTEVTLKNVHLRIETSAFNEVHDRFTAWFLKRRRAGLTRAVKRLYDVGTVVCVAGMVVGVAGLVWVVGSGIGDMLWPKALDGEAGEGVGRLAKRNWDDGVEVRELREEGSSFGLTPILPGVTVPLSDLPIIVVSVFIQQVIHELGHAVAAALDSIPVTSAGSSLALVIPTAFVAFSSASMNTLNSLAKARVIAAGPFHNLISWAVVVLLRVSGLEEWGVGFWYQDVGDVGRGVLRVEPYSPLVGHLVAGETVLTKLDDFTLGGNDDDLWAKFLLSKSEKPKEGWCVHRELLSPDEGCCGSNRGNGTNACFFNFGDGEADALGCVNPVPILTNTAAKRCQRSGDCTDGDEDCGVFDEKLSLLRITVQQGFSRGEAKDEKILLWSGPRTEVWEQVRVSRWIRKWKMIGMGWLSLIRAFRR